MPQLNNDFKHNELMQIWKPIRQVDSAGDAVDRLNKLVLNLTCKYYSNVGKVKGIVKDEQCDTPKIQVFMLP
jgi:hypothetical protein